MPNFTYDDFLYQFSYDPAQSTFEGRSVTNHHNVLHSFQNTIIFPSGTAGMSIWVNNDRYWQVHAQTNYAAMMNPGHYGDMASQNVPNLAFTGHWIDITVCPNITIANNNVAFINAPFRFIRIQGAAATGSQIGFLCSSNSEPGM